jgi:chaperonin GroEL (HSP60 family)
MNNCGKDFDYCLPHIGFDANLMKEANMIESGIINPAKSDRLALENAISVLNLYLSSSCLIVNEEVQF